MAGVPGWGVNLVSQSRAHRQNREEAEKDRALRKKLHDRQMNQQLGLALGQMAAKFGGQALTQGISNWRGDREKEVQAGTLSGTKDYFDTKSASGMKDYLNAEGSGSKARLTPVSPGGRPADAPSSAVASPGMQSRQRPTGPSPAAGMSTPSADRQSFWAAQRRGGEAGPSQRARDPLATLADITTTPPDLSARRPQHAAQKRTVAGYDAETPPHARVRGPIHRGKNYQTNQLAADQGVPSLPSDDSLANYAASLQGLRVKAPTLGGTSTPFPPVQATTPPPSTQPTSPAMLDDVIDKDAQRMKQRLASDPFLRRSVQARTARERKAAMDDAVLGLNQQKVGIQAGALWNKQDRLQFERKKFLNKSENDLMNDQFRTAKDVKVQLRQYNWAGADTAEAAQMLAENGARRVGFVTMASSLQDLVTQKGEAGARDALEAVGYAPSQVSRYIRHAKAGRDHFIEIPMPEHIWKNLPALKALKTRRSAGSARGGNTYVKVEQPDTAGDDVNTPGTTPLPTTPKGWAAAAAGGMSKIFPVDPDSKDYAVERQRQARGGVLAREIGHLMNTVEDPSTEPMVRMQAQSKMTGKRQEMGRLRALHAKGDSLRRRYAADAVASHARGGPQSPEGKKETKAKAVALSRKEKIALQASKTRAVADIKGTYRSSLGPKIVDIKAKTMAILGTKSSTVKRQLDETLKTGEVPKEVNDRFRPTMIDAVVQLKGARVEAEAKISQKIMNSVSTWRLLDPKAERSDFIRFIRKTVGDPKYQPDDAVKGAWEWNNPNPAPAPSQPKTPQGPGDTGALQHFVKLRDQIASSGVAPARRQGLFMQQSKALADDLIRQRQMTVDEANEMFRGIG